jgi:predicted protein tyrosine phosphatase
MNKPNYIATPVLVNILQEAKRSYDKGIVYLNYDTDKIFLEVYLFEDNHLDISMYIGEDKEITVKETQKDNIFDFIQEFYKEKREQYVPQN